MDEQPHEAIAEPTAPVEEPVQDEPASSSMLNADGELEVVATIHLPGLRCGDHARIPAAELQSPYIVACLAKEYVVPVAPSE